MSTTSGNMKSFKVTDKDGNVFVMTPVDTEARQAIDGAKNLEFDENYFTSDLSQDQSTVSVGLNGVPLGVDSDTPLKFTQDTPQGIVIGSDAPFATSLAPEYDSTATYQANESVVYQGNLYTANQDISTAEAWTSAHWRAAKSAPFIAKHGVTPYQKVLDAYNTGRIVLVRYIDNDVTYLVPLVELDNSVTPHRFVFVTPLEGTKKLEITYDANYVWSSLVVDTTVVPKVAVTGTLDSSTYVYTVDLPLRQYSLIEVPSDTSTLTINIPAASTGELDEASFKVIPQGSSIGQVNFIQDGYVLPVISNVPSGTMLSNQMYYQGTVVDGVVTFSEVDKPTSV